MFTTIVLLAQAASLSASDTSAKDGATPAEVFASIDGQWEGTIEYQDYQSNKLESIPMRADMESQPDGITMVQRLSFSDPRAAVYATNLISIDGTTLSGATARAGRPFETYEQSVRVQSAFSANSWTLIMSQRGNDANRPALIRETVLRDGAQMTITKEVDFLDDDKQAWNFRNRVTLEKLR